MVDLLIQSQRAYSEKASEDTFKEMQDLAVKIEDLIDIWMGRKDPELKEEIVVADWVKKWNETCMKNGT